MAFLAFLFLFLAHSAFAAEYHLSNAPTTLPEGYQRLEDGSLTILDQVRILPDGRILTPDGMAPQGSIPEGCHIDDLGRVKTPDGVVLPISKPDPALWKMLPLSSTKKDEKPAKEKKQKAEKKTRGSQLSIPERAAQKKDLRFLKGCWHTNDLPGYFAVWENTKNPGQKTPADICFGEKGEGSIRYFAHGECQGKVKAKFSGETLTIRTGNAPCAERVLFVPRFFECRRAASGTECAVLASHKNITRRSVIRLKRKVKR
ncbi:MAG: hypothetical protein IJU76_05815 [Desulfovibrionaceae bacterium]|nr:hypothetical protein [Desulfovibrionaceae bacterium]